MARRAVLEELLQDDHLARALALTGQDHVEGLVEDHFVAPPELGRVDVGVQRDPHLAAAGEDVDGAVVVGAEVGAVGGRRLGELLHLFAQGGDVLLGLLEGEGQLLVLGDGLGQLALGLEQLLLEGLDPARALLEPATQDGDLLLGRRGRAPQRARDPPRPSPGAGRRHRRNQPSALTSLEQSGLVFDPTPGRPAEQTPSGPGHAARRADPGGPMDRRRRPGRHGSGGRLPPAVYADSMGRARGPSPAGPAGAGRSAARGLATSGAHAFEPRDT